MLLKIRLDLDHVSQNNTTAESCSPGLFATEDLMAITY